MKIMHGLHNVVYFERKKRSCNIFTEFALGYLSAAM